MSEDQSLNEVPAAFTRPDKPDRATETVLDIDELMSAGRRVERVARFCIDGTAYSRLLEIDDEIAELDTRPGFADPGDEPLTGDRLTELGQEREQVAATVAAAMRTVRVQAMPDEEWRALLRKYKHDQGKALPNEDFWTELITECAVQPTLDTAAVAKLRRTLGMAQFNTIPTACWEANTTDGVDIPKLPASLREQKRRERSSS